jgi:serine/threonine protein kinase
MRRFEQQGNGMSHCPSCANDLEQDATYCGLCGARVRARRSTLVGTDLDGRFHIDAKIAEGGFGAIYRATHLPTNQLVALKVLHAELAADEMLAARFRREGETLQLLSSPHTVTVYEVGETCDGTLYIAMELLHGESLLDRLRSAGSIGWRNVLEIMKQVCRSLGEAHALGIIHRDLKPANIYLGTNDHVKVLDFGIAKLVRGSEIDDGHDLTRIGQAVGTLEYMAPEQLIGSTCDHRSDIYALGVVMYEMLTGRRPYADATGPTSLVAAVMTQPLMPPGRMFHRACYPETVDALVLCCLAKEATDRYDDVHALIAAIDEIILPLASGSYSTEIANTDSDSTWIDMPTQSPQFVITPSRQPVMHVDGIGFEQTHMQVIGPTTNPGLGPITPTRLRTPVTPSRAPTDIGAITPRGLARGSFSPVSPYQRARRQSDLELVSVQAFAEGSRVRPRPTPAPTGSLPLVETAAPPVHAPSHVPVQRSSVQKVDVTGGTRVQMSVIRVLIWTICLLAGGAGAGMLIAALTG